MNIKGIIKGTIISYIITAIFLFAAAGVCWFGVLKESTASVIVFCGVIISVFFGSFIAAKGAESKLLINSLTVSIMFILLIFIALLAVNGSLMLHTRTAALIGAVLATGTVAALFAR